jgi:hypothetical protein
MKMKKWRYMFYPVTRGETIAGILSKCGADGWEAWHIAEVDMPSGIKRTIYFKASFE